MRPLSKSTTAALPPRLSWNENLGGWTGGLSGKDLAHHPTGGHARRHMLALHYMFYNFGRIHQTLRVTPAM